jgi:hypothetical protein
MLVLEPQADTSDYITPAPPSSLLHWYRKTSDLGRLLNPLRDLHVPFPTLNTPLLRCHSSDRRRSHDAENPMKRISVEPHTPQNGRGITRPQPGTFSTLYRLGVVSSTITQDTSRRERLPVVHSSSEVKEAPNLHARQVIKLSPSSVLPV